MELTDMELEQLKLADNEESWNNLVDQIKEKRGGSYPPRLVRESYKRRFKTQSQSQNEHFEYLE